MIIWTPADSGRGGGARMAQATHFSESPVSNPVTTTPSSADVMTIDSPSNPCEPRAVADEDWCNLGESNLPADS